MGKEKDYDQPGTLDRLSRRSFLKKAAIIGLGIVTAGPVLFGKRGSIEPNKSGVLDRLDISAIPEEIRDDILTAEELEKAHIKIYPTQDVKLYLRRSALGIPIFKDAKDGKINGAVISLVNHDRLSWNAVDRLPQEPKSVWQRLNRGANPKNWPESYWGDLKKYTQDKFNYHQNRKEFFIRELSWMDEDLKRARDNIERYNRLIKESTDAAATEIMKDWLQYWELKLAGITNTWEEKATRIQKEILEAENNIKQAEKEWSILNGPRDKAKDYYAEYGVSEPEGGLIRPDAEWDNKAYIYLLVGGKYKLHPAQSLPGPHQFNVYKEDQGYTVYPKDLSTPGFVLGHEVGHYEEHEKDTNESEDAANRLAYELLMRAWRLYQETGSTSGYPFVFVTNEGVIITKTRNLEASAS